MLVGSEAAREVWMSDLQSSGAVAPTGERHRAWWHPAWRRPPDDPPDGEHFIEPRWPVVVGVLVAGGLSFTLPERLTFGPSWLAPLIEAALLLPLVLTPPHWHPEHGRSWQRRLSIVLFGVINLTNLLSLILLVQSLLQGSKASGAELILEAMKIWLTNLLVFGFWYWELDRGGPRARHWREVQGPDFLFPQMSTPEVAHRE